MGRSHTICPGLGRDAQPEIILYYKIVDRKYRRRGRGGGRVEVERSRSQEYLCAFGFWDYSLFLIKY